MKVPLNAQISPPTIKGKNLYLRPAKLTDYDDMKIYRQNEENCRFIRLPETDQQVLEIVTALSEPWQITPDRWNGLVICLNGETRVVGEVVFKVEDWQQQRAEIGYRLNNSVFGRGICTEATHLLIDYIIKNFGFYKLVAKCDPRNIASYKVMEKLGFIREAHFKEHYLIGDEWTDQYDYGLLARHWLAA